MNQHEAMKGLIHNLFFGCASCIPMMALRRPDGCWEPVLCNSRYFGFVVAGRVCYNWQCLYQEPISFPFSIGFTIFIHTIKHNLLMFQACSRWQYPSLPCFFGRHHVFKDQQRFCPCLSLSSSFAELPIFVPGLALWQILPLRLPEIT
jgi:hypothetical protein